MVTISIFYSLTLTMVTIIILCSLSIAASASVTTTVSIVTGFTVGSVVTVTMRRVVVNV